MKKFVTAVFTVLCCGLMGVQAAQPLLLDWGTIDTSSPEQQTASRKAQSKADSLSQRKTAFGTAPYLVQFNDVIREEWKTAMKKAGAELRGYIPEDAFLVEATPEVIAEIGAMPDVHWVGEYLPAYKRAKPVRALLTKGLRTSRDYNVIVFRPEDASRVAAEIAAIRGTTIIGTEEMTDRGLIRVTLPSSIVEEVTGWGEVEWVEPYVKPELVNDLAVRSDMMNATNVWTTLSLTGTGQVIAVCDTGLDTGNAGTLHQDFTGRLVWAQALGRSGDWSDTDSHGTHVAGSVLGSGYMSSGSYKGLAYEADLVFQSVLDSGGGLGGLPYDLNDLFEAAYTNGARIHNNSWGAANAGLYDTDSRNLDMFVWNNKSMLVVMAAGNEGIDSNSDGVVDLDSMDSPGTAKNCMTIGASETDRPEFSSYTWGSSWPDDFPTDPINSDEISGSDDGVYQGMAAFSSRGPCDDGRIKPDLIAPGTDIISTRSRAATDTGWGVAPNTNYLYMGGTSMATPLSSGAAALVRQWLIQDQGITVPSAAMIKCLMINGSRDMAPGQYGTGSYREISAVRPNSVQGFGHIDLFNTLQPATNQFLDLYDTNTLSTGYTNTFPLSVGTTTTNIFIVTMAYSDYYASSGSGKKLVNDLDLTIKKPSGTILYANGNTSVDATNNVEMIEFEPDETGIYTVRVGARTVPSGGSQPYALVVRGYTTPAASNIPPTLASIGNQTVSWSNDLQFAVTATETDGDTVTLSVSNAPSGSTLFTTNENGSFVWTNAGPVGVYTTTFYAVDSDGADSETITITVNDGNLALGLFVSEYIEGSGNNKAVEIFNGTGSSVDLGAGDYDLRLYFNGNSTYSTIDLTGTVADGDVFVVANSSANATILAQADMTSGNLTFNGNDVVALVESSSNIDVLGTIGSNSDYAKDVTKVRKSTVAEGATTYATGEWDNYAQDTTSYLGSHTFGGGSAVMAPTISYSPSGTNHTATVGSLLTITVTATEPNGDEIIIVDDGLPSGATFAGDIGYSPLSDDFTWIPSNAGTYQASFEAADDDGGVTSTIQIVVSEATSGEILACDFSSGLPSGWTNIDWLGNSPEQKWEFDNPGSRTFNALSASNGFAILDSDNYGSGNSQAADLVTPVTDFSGYTSVVLRFEHYFREYGTNDLGGVWYSTDGSFTNYTWFAIWTVDTANASTFLADISDQVAGESQVRIGWYYEGAYDYYWCVDDITISGEVAATTGDDVDGDGISDAYELEFSGTATGLTAGANNDGDAFNNYEEFLAWTDPTNAASYFKGSGAFAMPSQAISFPGSTARMYSLYFKTNFATDATWMPLFTNVVGTNTMMSITDTNERARVYYRLKVEALP